VFRWMRPRCNSAAATIAVAAWILIWSMPLVTIGWRAVVRPSSSSDTEFPAIASISAPPAWFETDSPLSRWPELIFRSLRLSVLAAISATSLGSILAFLIVRCRWRFAGPTRFLWSLALFFPLPVVATVWLGAFSNLGRSQAFGIASRPIVSGWVAAWIVHSIAALPLVVTILGSAFSSTDAELEDHARLEHSSLGAILRSTFRSVRPAIVASLLIVLIVTAGDMTVTDLVQERTFAEETYLQAQMGDGLTAAARTALPMTMMVAGAILCWTRFALRDFGQIVSRGFRISKTRAWFSGRNGFLAGIVAIIATGLFGALPLVSLTWRAGRSGGLASIERLPRWSAGSLARNLADAMPDLTETLLWTGLLASVVAIGGTVVAWCMVVSLSETRFGRICLALGAALGLAVPGPLAGLAVLWLWMPVPRLYDSLFVVVAAVTFRFLGVAVFLIWAAKNSIPGELEELARLDGISGRERFRRLRWPYLGPAAAVSAILLFAFAVGELPAANMTVPPGIDLMSVRLWSLMHTGMESHLAAFVLAIVVTFVIFFGVVILSYLTVLRRTDNGS